MDFLFRSKKTANIRLFDENQNVEPHTATTIRNAKINLESITTTLAKLAKQVEYAKKRKIKHGLDQSSVNELYHAATAAIQALNALQLQELKEPRPNKNTVKTISSTIKKIHKHIDIMQKLLDEFKQETGNTDEKILNHLRTMRELTQDLATWTKEAEDRLRTIQDLLDKIQTSSWNEIEQGKENLRTVLEYATQDNRTAEELLQRAKMLSEELENELRWSTNLGLQRQARDEFTHFDIEKYIVKTKLSTLQRLHTRASKVLQ